VLGEEDAAQMPVAHAELAGELGDARRLAARRARVERRRRLHGERPRGIHHRPGQAGPGRDLGPALEAGPERLGLGLRRRIEEAAVARAGVRTRQIGRQ
jgi:hypothetical protein